MICRIILLMTLMIWVVDTGTLQAEGRSGLFSRRQTRDTDENTGGLFGKLLKVFKGNEDANSEEGDAGDQGEEDTEATDQEVEIVEESADVNSIPVILRTDLYPDLFIEEMTDKATEVKLEKEEQSKEAKPEVKEEIVVGDEKITIYKTGLGTMKPSEVKTLRKEAQPTK